MVIFQSVMLVFRGVISFFLGGGCNHPSNCLSFFITKKAGKAPELQTTSDVEFGDIPERRGPIIDSAYI